MKFQKININKNHKVLLFDIVPEKKEEKEHGRTIMKIVFLIGRKTSFS